MELPDGPGCSAAPAHEGRARRRRGAAAEVIEVLVVTIVVVVLPVVLGAAAGLIISLCPHDQRHQGPAKRGDAPTAAPAPCAARATACAAAAPCARSGPGVTVQSACGSQRGERRAGRTVWRAGVVVSGNLGTGPAGGKCLVRVGQGAPGGWGGCERGGESAECVRRLRLKAEHAAAAWREEREEDWGLGPRWRCHFGLRSDWRSRCRCRWRCRARCSWLACSGR